MFHWIFLLKILQKTLRSKKKIVPLHSGKRYHLWQAKEQRTQLRGVAQLVAHLVWDQGVAGSNPVTPTT